MKARLLGLAALLTILQAHTVFGQTATGQVNGTVTDPAGASVPNAAVVLKNVANGIDAKGTTNGRGVYNFTNIRSGAYRLSVEAPGFKTAQVPEFTIEVNQTATRDVALTVGQVSESIEIRAEAEQLQQSSSELGTVITSTAVAALPLNGRNFTQLLTLTPGATPVSTSQGASIGGDDGSTIALPGSGFSNPAIHGQFNRSAVYFLDGVINTDFRTTTYGVLPNVDLIQEFKVQSHNDKAEYGSVAGGVINLVTKSGTNQIHGSFYEFLRNDVFDARDPYLDAQRSKPQPFRQNQFGATFGGPVIIPKAYNGRNKTFISGGYDGWRYARPTGNRFRVPTDQEIGGDFSNSIVTHQLFDPLTTRTDPTDPTLLIRDPFAGNKIPASRINSMTQGFIKAYYDRPNYNDPLYNVLISDSQRNVNDSWQIKGDHQLSERDSLWFRYNAMNVNQVTPTTQKSTSSWDMTAKNFGGGYMHVFSSHMILDLRGGYSSRPFQFVTSHKAGIEPLKALGFGNLDTFGGVQFNLLGPWGSAGFGDPNPRGNPVWSLSPNLSFASGSHNIKTGFQWVNVNRNQTSPASSYSFDDAVTGNPNAPGITGNSLASSLLGLPQTYTGRAANLSKQDFDIATWAAYVQDEWKVSRNLTLTAGLRFDHVNHVRLNAGMNNGPNMATGNWEIGAKVMPPSCNSSKSAPCIPGNGLQDVAYGSHIVLASDPQRWRKPTGREFGPRVSAAWKATDKMAIRAGYGLVYDALPAQSQLYQNTLNYWPFSGGFQNTLNATGTTPVFIQSLQASVPNPLPVANPWSAAEWFSSPDRKDAYSHQWNVEIQQQMAKDLMVSVAYVGSANRRTDVGGLANVARTPGTGNRDIVNSRKPYSYMSTFFYDDSIGSSNYNAFEFKLDRRFAAGFQALLSYTWSKSIDMGSSGYFSAENGAGGSSSLQNIYDLKGSRSVSSYDIPHFLSLSTNWAIPVGKGKRWLNSGPASYILGGWQHNMIMQVRSGAPYNLSVAGDVANIGNDVGWWNYARPNLVGNPKLSNPTDRAFYNTAAFSIPQFSYGNFGRNVLRTEPVPNFDMSLFKNIPISNDASRSVEFRAEAFNVFNNITLGVPGTTIGQPGAGVVTSAGKAPRVMQLGLRIVY